MEGNSAHNLPRCLSVPASTLFPGVYAVLLLAVSLSTLPHCPPSTLPLLSLFPSLLLTQAWSFPGSPPVPPPLPSISPILSFFLLLKVWHGNCPGACLKVSSWEGGTKDKAASRPGSGWSMKTFPCQCRLLGSPCRQLQVSRYTVQTKPAACLPFLGREKQDPRGSSTQVSSERLSRVLIETASGESSLGAPGEEMKEEVHRGVEVQVSVKLVTVETSLPDEPSVVT